MNTIEDIEKVVSGFLMKNHNELGLGEFDFVYNEEVMEHVHSICVSILCTKHGIGYPGGGFVQAVVNNDLMGAFGRADSINKKYIGLYVKLLYNY
jgi:hypothetical protein